MGFDHVAAYSLCILYILSAYFVGASAWKSDHTEDASVNSWNNRFAAALFHGMNRALLAKPSLLELKRSSSLLYPSNFEVVPRAA
jgi:hypothetical protein